MGSERQLRLAVPAAAENVSVLRQAAAGVADALALDPEALADLKTIVSEAAMNAVQHAYPNGNRGPVELTVEQGQSELWVSVRDYGDGFRPTPATGDTLRLGLPMIAALSDGFDIRSEPGVGTEIRVRIALAEERGALQVDLQPAPRATRLQFASTELLGPVLARMLAVHAARVGAPLERISESVLIGDAVAHGTGAGLPDEGLEVEIADDGGGVEMRIGPIASGDAKRLLDSLEIPGVGSLRALADSTTIEPTSDGDELLRLRLAGGARA